MDEQSLPLTPQARQRPDARGTPVEVDGETWLFADYVPDFDEVWDELFDRAHLAGAFDLEQLARAGVRLLYATGYDLTPEVVAAVVCRAPVEQLKAAVEVALFGPERIHRTYADWVLGVFDSNGLDLMRIPPERRRHALDMLVMTGRAVPAAKFVSSVEAAVYRQNMLSMAGRSN